MIIYKTTNLINNKIYIGKDKNNNPNYLGSGKILRQAIKKYGKINFKKEILEICIDKEYWLDREKYWIKYYNAIDAGYNIAVGGNGGDTISNNPQKENIAKEHSRKMKLALYNKNKARGKTKLYIKKKDNPDWINPRIGVPSPLKGRPSPLKGKPNPKVSAWMKLHPPFKGKTHSEEHKKKLREINSMPKTDIHKKHISENSPNNKKCNIDGISYRSIAFASKILCISESTIRCRLKNKKFITWLYEQ